MLTFVLLTVFVLLAGFFLAIAWGANQRRRAGMKGTPTAPPTGTDGGPASIHR